MRTCPNCGASIADTDEFCGNCGTYLGWLEQAKPAEAPPDQPPAVEPARPVAPRRVRAAEMPGPALDGPRCEVCGTVNRVGAKFCRKCGNSLVEKAAPQAVKRRWTWPRQLRWRGSGGSAWPRRTFLAILLAALVVAGFLLYPLIADLVSDARDKLSKAAPISPTHTTGSAEVPGHPVGAAVDGVSNQFWGAPAVGDSATFTFAQPFRLVGVVITPGDSTDPTAFAKQARPTAVDLVITTSDGTTSTVRITIADKPGPQTTNTGVSDVVAIRLVIRSATTKAPGQSIALGEIEFFRRA